MHIENALSYTFNNPDLLERALTHRSYRYEVEEVDTDNQRLEFLGDAVVDLLAADVLFSLYPEAREGDLSRMRSRCTSDQYLARVGNAIELGDHLKLGYGEEQSGGRARPSNLADAVEALFGAVYLDGGLDAARQVFDRLIKLDDDWLRKTLTSGNPKGTLLEYCQKTIQSQPQYTIISETGPPHRKEFTVQVSIESGSSGKGKGKSKREAEAKAAQDLLDQLEP